MKKLFVTVFLVSALFFFSSVTAENVSITEYLTDEIMKYSIEGDETLRITEVAFITTASIDDQSHTASGTMCVSTFDGNTYLIDYTVSTDGDMNLTRLENLRLVIQYDKLGVKYDLKKLNE